MIFTNERKIWEKGKGNELEHSWWWWINGLLQSTYWTTNKFQSCQATGNMITLSKDFDFSLGKQLIVIIRFLYRKIKAAKRKRLFQLNNRKISKELNMK